MPTPEPRVPRTEVRVELYHPSGRVRRVLFAGDESISPCVPATLLDAKDEAELRADAARWRAVYSLAIAGSVEIDRGAIGEPAYIVLTVAPLTAFYAPTLDAAADALIAALDVRKATP